MPWLRRFLTDASSKPTMTESCVDADYKLVQRCMILISNIGDALLGKRAGPLYDNISCQTWGLRYHPGPAVRESEQSDIR